MNEETANLKPYRICCAPGCRSNFSIDSEPIQTFPFPNNDILRRKWLLAVKANQNIKLIAPQICVKHFEEHLLLRQVDIETTGSETIMYPNGKVELYENAVPTIFYNEQPLINKKKIKLKRREIEEVYSKIENNTNFCRICLTSNIRLISLANLRNIDSDAIEIENSDSGNLFENLLAIKTSDLPTWLKICFACQNQLELFFQFRTKAKKVHKNLIAISKKPKLMKILSENSQNKVFITENQILKKSLVGTNDNYIEEEWNVNKEKYLFDEDSIGYLNNTENLNLNQEKIRYININTEENHSNTCCCNINNLEKLNYNNHLLTMGKSKNKCNCCLKKKSISEHGIKLCERISKNSNKQSYKCKYCLQKFLNIKFLRNHLKSHKITKNIQCLICNEQLSSNYTDHIMQKHGISVIGSNDWSNPEKLRIDNVTCQLCNIFYDTKEHLQQHLYYDHLVQYKLKCPFPTCCIYFLNEIFLKNHIKDHQNPEKQNFLCDINEEILRSKIDIEKESSQTRYTIHNVQEVIGGEDYEIVLEEFDSSNLSNKSNNNANFERSKSNNKEIQYIDEDNIINQQNEKYSITYNNKGDEEQSFFEIDINPDFY